MTNKNALAPTCGDAGFSIPTNRFDNLSYIRNRVQAVADYRTELGQVLRYLYLSNGPINLQR
jgi:hypothetical protein